MNESRVTLTDRRLAVWLFLLTFVVYGYFYAGAGWNQNSQFDLTRAIVERRTFAIDDLATNTGDVSRHGGHVYSNKSPGLSWLGAIPYAVIYVIESAAGVDPGQTDVLALNNYLCTLTTVVSLGALIPALLFLDARRRRIAPFWAAAVALGVALATQNFPYSTYFILHVPSGALLLMSLLDRRAWTSGFFAGLATTVNYLAAPALLFFALLHGRRDFWRFLAGSLPMLLFLALYQRICFGAFTTISLAKEDPRFFTEGAVMGIFGAPSVDALYGITFSPYRGLFYFAPVLLMGLIGLFVWARGVEKRGELLAILALCSLFFGFNVCFNGWEGGFGIGARYLVPLIPLFGVAMLHLRGWQRPLFTALAIVSFGINFTAAAVDPQPSGTIPRPLTQYLVPLLVHGEFSPDVPITPPWSATTFTGHTSVNRMAHDEAVVFTRHPPDSLASEWSSFNLGEPFFGAGDPRSLIPILIVIALGVVVILRTARRAQEASESKQRSPL